MFETVNLYFSLIFPVKFCWFILIGYWNIFQFILFYISQVYRLVQFQFEASRGAGAQNVILSATGCEFDRRSGKWNIYLNLYCHFIALVSRRSVAFSSTTQHAMPSEFREKRGTECLNIRFPLPTLQCDCITLFFSQVYRMSRCITYRQVHSTAVSSGLAPAVFTPSASSQAAT